MRQLFILVFILVPHIACAQVADQVVKKDEKTVTIISSKDVSLADSQVKIEQKKKMAEDLLRQINFLNSQVDKINNEILDLESPFQTVGIDPTKPVAAQATLDQPVSP